MLTTTRVLFSALLATSLTVDHSFDVSVDHPFDVSVHRSVDSAPLHHDQDAAVSDAPKVDADLAKFAWIVGAWRKRDAKQTLEERWDPPLGNAMTGTFRWFKKDVGWVYEFLLIEKTAKGVTFYLRHFGAGSKAWEPVDAPLDFPLKSVKEGEAIFEHPTRDKMKRLVYRREKATLTVRVEGISSDGKTAATVFRFARLEPVRPAQRGGR